MSVSGMPASWKPSDLAESLVEGLTGSEGLGDIAGMAAAHFTGDAAGVAGQGQDLMENVGKGLMKFAEGVFNAAKDAVQVFSNPGAVKSPSQEATQGTGGYAPGEATGPTDTGVVGDPPAAGGAQGAGQTEGAGGAEGSGGAEGASGTDTQSQMNDLDAILNDPGASLESKVFALLSKLQLKSEGKLEGIVKKMGTGKDDKLNQKDMTDLQRAQADVSQLTSITTSLLQGFKQMKDSIIQNIGR